MGATEIKDGSSDNQLVVNSDGSINIAGGVVPSGGATSANQVLEITELTSIDTKTPALGQAAMTSSVPVAIASNQSAVPVSVASLPLPADAATSALQTTGNTSLSSIDSKFGPLGQNAMAGSAPVVIASNQSALPSSQSGVWNITNVSGIVSLPTGASTSSLQTTGNTSLSSLDGKLGSLGQKVMTGSAPVVIASDQSAVAVSAAALPLPSGAATSGLQTTGNTSLSSIDGKLGSLGQKAMTGSAPVVIASDQSAVAISAASLPLPSGAATSGLQSTGNTSLASIDTKTPALGQALAAAAVPVVLTAIQLTTLTPLTSVAATQSGTWNISNVSGTVSLPTGASTSSLQSTGNTSIASIDTKTPALGQAVMASSVPVAIASNQSAVSTAPSTPAAAAITQAGLSVGLTAVRLTVSGSAPSASRQLLVATPNITGAKFYVGSSAVTTSTGVTILGGQSFIANNDACDYYVISDTASQTVFVMEH